MNETVAGRVIGKIAPERTIGAFGIRNSLHGARGFFSAIGQGVHIGDGKFGRIVKLKIRERGRKIGRIRNA
jgi:hypothetical protein